MLYPHKRINENTALYLHDYLVQDHESHRPAATSPFEWEQQWEKTAELRGALGEVRQTLGQYADLLAEVAQVPSLIVGLPRELS